MFVFHIFFTLLYITNSNGELGAEPDVYHTLFGNIASMEDLFLKEPEGGKTPAPTPKPSTTPAPDDNEDDFDGLDLDFPDAFKLNRTNISNHTFDILDFLVINEKYSNITKEYKEKFKSMPNRTRRLSYADPDDEYYYENVEHVKRKQLTMVMVQFALHCRYEVGKALLQRDLIRGDKRYKIGYLFNRMRRLKTELLKMVGAGWQNMWSDYRHMYTMMRLYERAVHFDVDMRDTAALIRRIFNVDAPYDKIELKKKKT